MARVLGHVGADFFPEQFSGLTRGLAGFGRKALRNISGPKRKTCPLFQGQLENHFCKDGWCTKEPKQRSCPVSVPPIMMPNFSPTHLSYLSEWHHGDSTQKKPIHDNYSSFAVVPQPYIMFPWQANWHALGFKVWGCGPAESLLYLRISGHVSCLFLCEWWEGVLIDHIGKCLEMFGYVWCVCPLCGDFNKWLVPGHGFFWDARYSYDVKKNCKATWWWTIIHALQMKGNDENWNPASFPGDTQSSIENLYFEVT